MAWGWQKGLGRGLMQFGSTLNQGLQTDIRHERQLERDRMADEIARRREESIERRWQAQMEKADERHQQQLSRQERLDARQIERDAESDRRYNSDLALREARVIEGNLGGILAEKQKAEQAIVERYRRMMIDPITGQPIAGAQAEQLQNQMRSEIEQARQQYSQLLDQRVKSYGNKLRGTGYAYLLDVQDAEQAQEVQQPMGSLSAQSNDDPIDGFATNILNRGHNANSPQPTANPNGVEPTFMNGLRHGLGGLYQSDAPKIDESDLSPLENYAVSMGHFAGGIPGLLGDAGQLINNHAFQPVYDWATTKPSQQK